MPDLKALIGEFHAEIDKLEADVASRLHGLLDQLLHHVPAVETEVKTDAATDTHDAEATSAPVATDVKHDAATSAAVAVEAAVKP